MSLRRGWVCAILCAGFAVLQMNETSAMARNGLLSRLKSGEGGCLFSCGQPSEMAREVAVASEEGNSQSLDPSPSALDEATAEEALSEGKRRRGGLFARMRSKKDTKEGTVDAQDIIERSSSDLPVEAIPPAPER